MSYINKIEFEEEKEYKDGNTNEYKEIKNKNNENEHKILYHLFGLRHKFLFQICTVLLQYFYLSK